MPVMIANTIFLVGVKEKGPLLALRQKRRSYRTNLLQSFKNFKLYEYLEKNIPTYDADCFCIGLYLSVSMHVFFVIAFKESAILPQKLYDVIIYAVGVCITGLLALVCRPNLQLGPVLPSAFRFKRFIWPVVIGHTMFVVNTQVGLMNEPNIRAIMIILSAIMSIAIYLLPSPTLLKPILGILIGYLILVFCYVAIPYDGVFGFIKFNFIYILFVVINFLLSIFRAAIFRVKRQLRDNL
jgi:hypothetical protein